MSSLSAGHEMFGSIDDTIVVFLFAFGFLRITMMLLRIKIIPETRRVPVKANTVVVDETLKLRNTTSHQKANLSMPTV